MRRKARRDESASREELLWSLTENDHRSPTFIVLKLGWRKRRAGRDRLRERRVVGGASLVGEENREPQRSRAPQERYVTRRRIAVIDADDRVHLVAPPARAQSVRDREIRPVLGELVVVRLREQVEVRVAPRGEVDREHVVSRRGAVRRERRRKRGLDRAEGLREVGGAPPESSARAARVRG